MRAAGTLGTSLAVGRFLQFADRSLISRFVVVVVLIWGH